MKKSIILLAVATVAVFNSCGSSGSAKLNNEMDSLAYVYGVDFGMFVKQIDSTMNVDVIAKGMKDVLANKELKISTEDAQNFLNEYFTVRMPAKKKKDSEAFIENIKKTNKNAKVTESGLVYEIISEGDGAKATKDEDEVVVNYLGTLPDGNKFDSSYDRGEPATFPLNGVIKGWTEGLKLVNAGGKIKLWIPSELGYGEQGSYSIQPNQALIFEVELLEVHPAEEATE